MVVFDEQKSIVGIVVVRKLDSMEEALKAGNAFVVVDAVTLSFGRTDLIKGCASVSGLSAGSLRAIR